MFYCNKTTRTNLHSKKTSSPHTKTKELLSLDNLQEVTFLQNETKNENFGSSVEKDRTHWNSKFLLLLFSTFVLSFLSHSILISSLRVSTSSLSSLTLQFTSSRLCIIISDNRIRIKHKKKSKNNISSLQHNLPTLLGSIVLSVIQKLSTLWKNITKLKLWKLEFFGGQIHFPTYLTTFLFFLTKSLYHWDRNQWGFVVGHEKRIPNFTILVFWKISVMTKLLRKWRSLPSIKGINFFSSPHNTLFEFSSLFSHIINLLFFKMNSS